ncbi:IreB family regulatory phosphoprotein [Guggenheimella bovis]
MENNNTQKFNNDLLKSQETRQILLKVYDALVERGYNPINQLVGYFISGDPTYITSNQDARNLIKKIDRDEILEILLKNFIDNER